MDNAFEKKLALSHFWVAFAAFALACLMGGYQVLDAAASSRLLNPEKCITHQSVPTAY